ncbi:MAG: tRNA adenosine(34) deaminase TadA [bacterium]|nr:tRNA adenosine(34) deaminase TadA [bacterium]
MNDLDFMRLALQEAEQALHSGDVPIGAVAAYRGAVIGTGYNRREADHDPTAHAEMLAIRAAAAHLGHWRLDEVTLYCTLEPCAMCAGAMVLARLPRLVYAAVDLKAGAAGSVMDVCRHDKLNHRIDVQGGFMADKAAEQLHTFFRSLRT